MKDDTFQHRPRRLSDRLMEALVILPVVLWHVGRALFGIAIGLLLVLLALKWV
ncbi:hypothetical protein [Pseudooceanicola sp. 200-1SW]|uniref:hypothetical protein n=1 Tax=Pseudooceanicola sp. 200-1SW TaxID=3425949 RepID=UPI003D7F8B44